MLRRKEDMKEWQLEALEEQEKIIAPTEEVAVEPVVEKEEVVEPVPEPVVEEKPEEKPKKKPATKKTTTAKKKIEKMDVEG